MRRLDAILADADLTVTGHALVNLRFEQSRSMLDPDGVTYHGISRYRVVTRIR